MNKSHNLLLLLLLIHSGLIAQVLVKNTNVLDVENKKILSGYDVVVLEGRIISVEKGKQYKLPPGTDVIDGTGKYLVPGFADAHVHFFQSGGLYARPDVIDLRKYQPHNTELKWVHDNMEDLLHRYTATGITSVVDVGASFNFLQQRDSLMTRTALPVVSMTGPLLTTWLPPVYKDLGNEGPFTLMKTKEDAIIAVKEQLKYNADFIKIWYIVLDSNIEAGARKNYEIVKAAIEEAHKNNKRVAVHAMERITAQLAVEAGADFLVHSVTDEYVSNEFVQLLKKRNVVLCPTLVVGGNYSKVLSDNYQFSTYELEHAHPFTISTIIDYPWPDTLVGKNYIKTLQYRKQTGKPTLEDTIMAVNLKKLADAGVTIATGTDAGNIGTQHATSYFDELSAMQQAGLNMWQLLQASTINGAKAVGQEKEWGSISKNKLGNMVLLNANPLDSLANWKKIDRVINKGKMFMPDSLVHNTPVMLVQQQLNAYNAHDLDAFLAPYADDVEIYSTTGKLQMKGKEEMRKQYTFITQLPYLYCKLVNRIVSGNTVIDHEEIWLSPKPDNLRYGVAIYVILNGKISKVYFAD
ncbi:MAG TPA: amidohydrolase family protein [Chitinophagaceae bacterium]|nr:amidohydrolase family protein [Chitinophagaceae bacterium]HQV85373.1 amidohydrolase family protein [Chitinophagaceae bacterium]